MSPQTTPQYIAPIISYVPTQGGFPGLMYSGHSPHGVWGTEGQMDPMVVFSHHHHHHQHEHQQQHQQQQDHTGPVPISYGDTHHLHHHLSQPMSHESKPPLPTQQAVGLVPHHPSLDLRHPAPPPPPHITTNSPFSVDFLLGQRGVGPSEGANMFPAPVPPVPTQNGDPSLLPSLSHHHDPPAPSLVVFSLTEEVPGPTPFIRPLDGTHFSTRAATQDRGTFPDVSSKRISSYHNHVAMETCPSDVASGDDDDGSRLALELPPEKPFSPPGLVLGKGEEDEEGRREGVREEVKVCSPKRERSSLQHYGEQMQLIGGQLPVPEVRAKVSQTNTNAPPTSNPSHHSSSQSLPVQPLKHLDVPVAMTAGTPDNNVDDDDDVFLPDSPQGKKPKSSKAPPLSCREGPPSHRRGRIARNADLVKLQLPLSNGYVLMCVCM